MQEQSLSLIEQIRDGMTVIDAKGEKLGTVEFVKMSDAALTSGAAGRRGQADAGDGPDAPAAMYTPGAAGALSTAAGSSGTLGAAPFVPGGTRADVRNEEAIHFFDDPEPGVSPALRRRLLQKGFIKIDGYGPDFLDTDRYVAADQIDRIDGDHVHLLVAKGQIATEES